VLVAAAGPAIDELVDSRPYFVAATIPGGLYRGSGQDVATLGVCRLHRVALDVGRAR